MPHTYKAAICLLILSLHLVKWHINQSKDMGERCYKEDLPQVTGDTPNIKCYNKYERVKIQLLDSLINSIGPLDSLINSTGLGALSSLYNNIWSSGSTTVPTQREQMTSEKERPSLPCSCHTSSLSLLHMDHLPIKYAKTKIIEKEFTQYMTETFSNSNIANTNHPL